MFFFTHEEGQGLVEYAMIIALVAIVVVVVLALLGTVIDTQLWTKAWNELRCAFTSQCSSLLPAHLMVSRLVLLL